MRVKNGVVFAVAGSKGGVGKTTTSINLGAALAEADEDVVLVEFDLAMANVGDFLDIDVGLEGEDPTLHEVLAGTATVVDATYESPAEFDVVPSGATLRGYGDADIGRLSGVLETLRFAYDVVLLDTGAGVTAETVLPLALADETILVSSPRVASVRDTMKTRDLTRQVGGSVAGVVFVKSGTGRSPGVDHIADFLSVDLLGHIPEDSAVPNAQDRGVPVVVAAPESDAAGAFRDLGVRMTAHATALGTPDALSTERLSLDESGFAFVDTPPETGEADETGQSDGFDGDSDEASDAGAGGQWMTNGQTDENENENENENEGAAPTDGDPGTDTVTDDTVPADSGAGDDDLPSQTDPTIVEALAGDPVTDVPEPTTVSEPRDEPATVAAADTPDHETSEEETPAVDNIDRSGTRGPAPAVGADDVDSSESLGVADGGRTGEVDGQQDETEDSQPRTDGPESTPSATRRLIHRARDLVDRRND